MQADYGQKKFNWTKKDGWEWSEEDETTELYTALGALGRVRSKEIIPLRYTKEKGKITYADAAADQKAFEDRKFVIEPQALWRYYGEKGIHYIQVGEGFGFYHLDEDTARLGTPQFVCQFILRFRAKYHDRYKRTRDESGKVLSKKKTPWNYSFFAVLKVRKKPQKSKYNLEPSEEQNLPPIKPNP